MNGILFVLALPFAAEVDRLGHPDYQTRQSAHQRLKSSGWPAAPAVYAGTLGDNLERADRCGRLLAALPDLDAALVRLLLAADRVPEVPEGVWVGLRPAVERYGEGLKPLPVRGDSGQYFHLTEHVGDWMIRMPYYGGTAGGEVRIVLTAARQKHRGGLAALTGPAAQESYSGGDTRLTPIPNR